MKYQKFIIPYRPNSTNTHWAKTRSGHTYLSKKAREFRSNVQTYIKAQEHKKYTGRLKVKIELYFKTKRKRDVDNYNKSILDCFNGLLWEDDEQIEEIRTIKHTGTGQEDYFIIEIIEI